MNFPMFSCSQFPPNRKQSTMSKRAQERRIRRGTCGSKSRGQHVSVWCRETCWARDTPLLQIRVFHTVQGPELRRCSVPGSTKNPVSDRVRNSATNSQEWQRDDNPFRCTVKPVRGGVCERSRSTRKPVRGAENQLARTRLDHHKMHISDYQYFEKVFKNVRQRLNRLEDDQNDGSNSQCINLEITCVSNESISSSWAKLQREFGCVEEHHFRRAQDVFRHYEEVDLGTCIPDSEWFHDWMVFITSDEIHFTTWQAKVHVYLESVFESGKDVRASWSKCKMGKSTRRIFPQSNTCRELGGINGEPIEFECNWSQDSLDVDVQRQRLDKENCEECLSNSEKVKICAKKRFPRGQWTFLGQGEDDKWNETYTYKVEE